MSKTMTEALRLFAKEVIEAKILRDIFGDPANRLRDDIQKIMDRHPEVVDLFVEENDGKT